MTNLVLSLFPGIDLLGRGFEDEGFCVVRGPDIIYGQNIEGWTSPPPGRIDGIIGGPPCQDFSRARRTPPTGDGLRMIDEFTRVVTETEPSWFLMENVPMLAVPDVLVDGYTVQRFDLNARECGLSQSRLRYFQYGSREGFVLVPERQEPVGEPLAIALASEGSRPGRRSWPDFCELFGLPRDFSLPGLSVAAKYRAVGNGVPIPMARVVARAIREASVRMIDVRLCVCNCGRIVQGQKLAALPACRKRMQRRRDLARLRCDGSVTEKAHKITKEKP